MDISLNLAPPTYFRLPSAQRTVVCLVGCGGTGSHLAYNIVKLMLDARARGLPPITLYLIDGDHVELKNVQGRQLFVDRDVGRNKAEVLAARINAAYGLQVVAIPEMATTTILSAIKPRANEVGLLVGAVDRPSARQVLHAALRDQRWHGWLECGNEVFSGQVCFGTTVRARGLHGALIFDGMCTKIPAPSLAYPALLTRGEEAPQMDCAQRIVSGDQSLLINMQVAAIAALYLQKLLIDRQIDYFTTQVSIDPPTTVSQAISRDAFAHIPGVLRTTLRGATLRRRPHDRMCIRRYGHHQASLN